MTSIHRTMTTCVSATGAGRPFPSHDRPQTFIGVMLGGDAAKRRKIATECAKRPAGRDLLKGPDRVLFLGPASRLFS